jgi:hypothetical protein
MGNPITERRFGIVRIQKRLFETHTSDLDFYAEFVKLGIVAFKAEFNYSMDEFEIHGASFLFDPIPPGSVSPYYAVIIEIGQDGNHHLKVG